MKKRFWKWNAIAAFVSLILYVWFVGCSPEVDGLAKALAFLPSTYALISYLVLLNHKNKSDDAIVGLSYDEDKTDPKQLLLYIMLERNGMISNYSLVLGFIILCSPCLPVPLRTQLGVGIFCIGVLCMLWVTYDYFKKRRQLNH